MSKKSEVAKAIEHLDAQIAALQQAKAALVATLAAVTTRKQAAARTPKPEPAV